MRSLFRPERALATVVLLAIIASGLLLRETAIGPVLGIAAVLAAGALVIYRVRRNNGTLAAILALALALRVAAAVLDQMLNLFPKNDQGGYLYLSTMLARSWHGDVAFDLSASSSVTAYVQFLAPFFYVFGPHPLIPRFLSALLGLGCVLLVHHIASRLTDRRSALIAAGLYAVYPSFVYIQSETLRDPLIHFLILGAIALTIAGRPRRTPQGFGLVLALGVLSVLRLPALIITLVPVTLLVVMDFVKGRNDVSPDQGSPALHGPDRPLRVGMSTVLAVAALVLAAMAALGSAFLPMLLDEQALTNYRDQWALGGSGYLEGRVFSDPLDVLLFLPLGALYFLFTPFPWMIHNTLSLIAALENLLVAYPLALLAAMGLRRRNVDPRLLVLVLFLVVGATLFGLIEGNAGTALRHRAQFTWVFLVLAAPVLAGWGARLPLPRALRRSAPVTQ